MTDEERQRIEAIKAGTYTGDADPIAWLIDLALRQDQRIGQLVASWGPDWKPDGPLQAERS